MTTKVIVWPFYKKFQPVIGERVLEVNTVARNSGLSPFVIGPCSLWGGHVARNMENAWQFSKVYQSHLGHDGEPSEVWLRWAMTGWKDSRAHRYPMGKGARPEYSFWDGQHLSYIEARKVIYGPLYAEAVKSTEDWKELWRNFADDQYDTIVLRDFDAYDHAALGMSLTEVLNCPVRKMGHAFVLAMLLTDDPALNQVELVPAWKRSNHVDRAINCRTFLYLHGYLSESENRRVIERLRKRASQSPSSNRS